MVSLSGDTPISLVLYDDNTGSSATAFTGMFDVVPVPAWMGHPDDDSIVFSGSGYDVAAYVSLFSPGFDTPADWPIIGGRHTGIDLGFGVDFSAPLDAWPISSANVSFEASAELLDLQVYNCHYDAGTSLDAGPLSVEFHPNIVLDGETLEISQLGGTLDVDFGPFTYALPTPPILLWPTPPISLRVPIELDVSAGVNLTFAATDEATIGFTAPRSVRVEVDGSVGATVNVGIPYVLELGGGVAVVVEPSLVGALEPDGSFSWSAPTDYGLDWVLSGSIFGWPFEQRGTLIEESIDLLADGSLSASTDFRAVSGASIDSAETIILSSDPCPQVACSPDGQAMMVYLDFSNPDGSWEVYYQHRDAEGIWSTVAPITSNNAMEWTPSVAFAPDGSAYSFWGQSKLSWSELQTLSTGELQQALAGAELYVARWDGVSWSTPLPLTNDALPDARPQVAFAPDGSGGIVLWDRWLSADPEAWDRSEIAYGCFDGASWQAPQLLTSDNQADWDASLAYTPSGNAVAVWLTDSDGDTSTTGICYAWWDGSAWSAPGCLVQDGITLVREPSVVALSDGRVVAFWTQVENGLETLYASESAAFEESWSLLEPVVARAPLVDDVASAVSTSDDVLLIYHGLSGTNDLFAIGRAFSATSSSWGAAIRLTDDLLVESHIALEPPMIWFCATFLLIPSAPMLSRTLSLSMSKPALVPSGV